MSEFPKTRIRFRRGTAAQWSSADPVLASGEPGFIVDSNTLKIGDGTTAFASLSSISGGGGGGGDVVDDTTPQLGGNLDVNSRNIIGTGNVALTGSGTFTSIIKTGGTSSQFLKADGSSDSNSYQQILSEGAFANGDKTKLDGIEASADVTDATNVTAAGALMDSEVTNLSQVKAFDSSDYATAAQGTKADSAQQPPSEGAFVNGDKTKLDGIEASADVTDATNVNAAGAVMNSDTSTASMSFVVDEDSMSSNSATKVPTQQSVKAYVDANAGGDVADDTSPQLGGVLDINSNNIIGTGNIALTGSGTFMSVIKSGGTSSQFLKADGSVDSSTYLTSALANVVEDTTPQLGGALDAQSNNINSVGSLGVGGGATFEKSLIVNNAGVGTSADFQVKEIMIPT